MANTITPHGNASVLQQYASAINAAAKKYNVDPVFIGAIIMHESGGVPGKTQPNGLGRGLMQVDIGQNPQYNSPLLTQTSPAAIAYQIDAGTQILAKSLAASHGNTTAGLQGYAGSAYRGPGGVDFATELRNSYFTPVAAALGISSGTMGGAVAPGSISIGPFQNIDPGSIPGVSGIEGIASTLGSVVSFFADPTSWLRILMALVGLAFLIGGVIHATGTDQKVEEIAPVIAAAA